MPLGRGPALPSHGGAYDQLSTLDVCLLVVRFCSRFRSIRSSQQSLIVISIDIVSVINLNAQDGFNVDTQRNTRACCGHASSGYGAGGIIFGKFAGEARGSVQERRGVF